MPMFNCADYVEAAIQSVIHQTWTDWELICIDDCSTDSTNEIVTKLASLEPRIKLYRLEKNSEKSVARNYGLWKSKGEFLFFLDADDWISQDALSALHEMMIEDEADMVLGQIIKVREGSDEVSEGLHKWYQHLDIRGLIPVEEPNLLLNVVVCNKLLRRQFIEEHSCRFFNESLARFEDSELAMKWWLHEPKTSQLRKITYFYRQQAEDLQCRSNRKKGGIDFAPFYRIDYCLALLRYRHEVGASEERLLLPRLIMIIVRNLRWTKKQTKDRTMILARECARTLSPQSLDALCVNIRDMFLELRNEPNDRALELLDAHWEEIQKMEIEDFLH